MEANNSNNQEFGRGCARISRNWFRGPNWPRGRCNRVDESDWGHETCTASLISGSESGVSGHVNIFPVKVFDDIEHFLWLFPAIENDINRRRIRPGYITIYCGGYAGGDFIEDYADEFVRVNAVMASLMNLGVLIVVIAGNEALQEGRGPVDIWPAVHEGSKFPLIIVGSRQRDGTRATYSQTGPHVDICAFCPDS